MTRTTSRLKSGTFLFWSASCQSCWHGVCGWTRWGPFWENSRQLEKWCVDGRAASLQWNPPKPPPPRRQRTLKSVFCFRLNAIFFLKSSFLSLIWIKSIIWGGHRVPALFWPPPRSNRLALPTDNCGTVCFSHTSKADFIPIIKILLR